MRCQYSRLVYLIIDQGIAWGIVIEPEVRQLTWCQVKNRMSKGSEVNMVLAMIMMISGKGHYCKKKAGIDASPFLNCVIAVF